MNQILGSMRRVDEHRGAVRVEDVYNTDIDDLWSAVTDPDRLGRWIATVEGDFKVGGHVQTLFTSTWEGPGRIDVCDPPHHLVVTMEPGTDDEAVIEAVLTAEGEQTRLVVEERGDARGKHTLVPGRKRDPRLGRHDVTVPGNVRGDDGRGAGERTCQGHSEALTAE